jgi:hypothetical protein
MIIGNATVCATMDHGGNRKHKIVGRRQRQQDETSGKKGSEQGKQEMQKGCRK